MLDGLQEFVQDNVPLPYIRINPDHTRYVDFKKGVGFFAIENFLTPIRQHNDAAEEIVSMANILAESVDKLSQKDRKEIGVHLGYLIHVHSVMNQQTEFKDFAMMDAYLRTQELETFDLIAAKIEEVGVFHKPMAAGTD